MPAQATAKIVIASANGGSRYASPDEQEQDCRNKGPGVADADPPNEVRDSKAHPTGMLMPQMPTPLRTRHPIGEIQYHKEAKRNAEAEQPTTTRWPFQDDRADLLVHALAFFDGRVHAFFSSGLGLKTFAR